MELIFVTGNKHKVEEINKILGKKIKIKQKKLEIK